MIYGICYFDYDSLELEDYSGSIIFRCKYLDWNVLRNSSLVVDIKRTELWVREEKIKGKVICFNIRIFVIILNKKRCYNLLLYFKG